MTAIGKVLEDQRIAVTNAVRGGHAGLDAGWWLRDAIWHGSAVNHIYHIEQGGEQVRLYGRYEA